MIPVLLLLGLVIGRWWFVAVAAVGWPVWLVVERTGNGWQFVMAAATFAAANAVVGVVAHRGMRWIRE